MTSVASLWVDQPAPESPAGAALRVEQITVILRQTGVLATVNILNALFCVAVLWPVVDPLAASLWASLLIALSAHRLARWWPNRNHARPPQVRERTIDRAVWIAAILGAAWGSAALLAYPADSDLHKLFLFTVLGGMAGGSAVALAPIPAAAVFCGSAMLLPMIVRVALDGTPVLLGLAAMGVVLLVALFSFVRTVYASFVATIGARVVNDNLMSELQLARRDLLDAIASTSEAFALFDDSHRLVVCNRHFGEFLSIAPASLLVGADYRSLMRQSSPPAAVAAGERAIDDWLDDIAWQRGNEASFYVQQLANGRWLQTSDRRTSRGGFVTTHVDITTLKHREAALERARLEAEEANRAKSDFLALMSHELRTPLNAVLGFSELLRDEVFGRHSDPRYGEYADDIHRSGSLLLQVINDILDLSKIEAGRYDLSCETIPLDQFFGDLKRLLAERVRRAGLELDADVGSETVFADPRALKQMLLNLLSNAIKFTPEGGRIRMTALHDGGAVEIAIADTGIGIAEKDLAKVLEPFRQAGNTLTREYEGTGLGLPLVRSLASLHGGEMRLASTVGAGTTVTLRLPFAPAADAQAAD